MAECAVAGCINERRLFRKELQRWGKQLVFYVGKWTSMADTCGSSGPDQNHTDHHREREGESETESERGSAGYRAAYAYLYLSLSLPLKEPSVSIHFQYESSSISVPKSSLNPVRYSKGGIMF